MSVQFKDYYQTLGVSRDATADEIKKAYRKLARQHHPDRAKAADKATAEERIKEINEAYEILKDPAKRAKYDQLGADWDKVNIPRGHASGSHPFGGFGSANGASGSREFHFGGTGFSDFFEQFFGSGVGESGSDPFGADPFGASSRHAHSTRRHTGHDLHADLMVELEEAARGATRPISLRYTDPHSGEARTLEFKVRVPAGVRDGQQLRVRGRGGAGDGSGPAGDLLLRVRLAPHPDFRVEGSDLLHDLELEPWEAVLGTKVEVPTLDGSMRLTIPAGTPAGRKLRIRGRGLPASAKGPHGDLYVVISLHIPEPDSLSTAEREAWEQLANTSKKRDR